MLKYVHTNIVSGNGVRLAEFYKTVFGCTEKRSESRLSGEWLDKGTGIKDAEIKSIELNLPGYDKNGPYLEIFEYSEIVEEQIKPIANKKGLGHLAFGVDDVNKVLNDVLAKGGGQVGELVQKEFKSGFLSYAYVTDPEGNIIEIQSWKAK